MTRSPSSSSSSSTSLPSSLLLYSCTAVVLHACWMLRLAFSPFLSHVSDTPVDARRMRRQKVMLQTASFSVKLMQQAHTHWHRHRHLLKETKETVVILLFLLRPLAAHTSSCVQRQLGGWRCWKALATLPADDVDDVMLMMMLALLSWRISRRQQQQQQRQQQETK